MPLRPTFRPSPSTMTARDPTEGDRRRGQVHYDVCKVCIQKPCPCCHKQYQQETYIRRHFTLRQVSWAVKLKRAFTKYLCLHVCTCTYMYYPYKTRFVDITNRKW